MEAEQMPNRDRSYNEVAVAVAVSAVIRRQSAVIAAAVVAVAAANAVAFAQSSSEKLGTISFPNSGNAAAQEPFLKGMKLYWSFEYERAAIAFQEAQKADPTMTLAYVGEALTHTHQVWNQQNLQAARAALAKLAPTSTQRLAAAKTERERMYGELVESLYGEGSKPRRDTLFTDVAERLVKANPTDDEAKVFHAIGLLGLNQSVREPFTYMKAGAIAEEVFRRNADHPGAAHFVIHAYDDPGNALKGLAAARAYSKIAPAAPHAQHMTTHIFVALGMWDDVISQNIAAAGHDHGSYVPGHYTWWLGYGYVQAGRYDDARKHLETVKGNLEKGLPRASGSALQMMRAHYVIDGERWSDPIAGWNLAGLPNTGYGAPSDQFVRGLVALKTGDAATAAALADAIGKAAAPAPGKEFDAGNAARMLEKMLRGAIASGQGRHADAIAAARQAAAEEEALPYEFGPPMIAKPTYEMLGELLLAAGRASEAKEAFERGLARTPGRTRSLIGLAKAALATTNATVAASVVGRIKANWHAADANLTELNELMRMLASGAP
jgi:tetratricopeptide (TPR) repeat protein